MAKASQTAASREPPDDLIMGEGMSMGEVNDRISLLTLRPNGGRGWLAGFTIAFMLLMLLLASVSWLFAKGVGIWGIRIPVAWGFAIVNFVWWIGIGHAGTFISAILLLLNQDWRNSINRLTEAMTLFAVACAALFPLLHLGRPQYFYFIVPHPNTLDLWPQFRSPLVWDLFAVFTYGTVSLIFWYLGLVPDLASLRDRVKYSPRKKLYTIAALGWTGSATQWRHYRAVYLVLAGLATPLVISVHSIVGLDFAFAIVPGWHTTVFPPFFVAGAIFSGFAMVTTIVVPLRRYYRLERFITRKHLDNIGKVMLTTGTIVGFGYLSETFFEYYSAESFGRDTASARLWGKDALVFYSLLFFNIVCIQPLWSRRVRTTPWMMFILSIFVNIGMWLERFFIVVTSLQSDYLPSSRGEFGATFWDWSTFLGTIGLFACLLFIFVRILPIISMHELRVSLVEGKKGGGS